MKKAILYTRIDKTGVVNPTEDLSSQEAELRKYCRDNNIEVLQVIKEVASGKDFNRLEFTSLHLAIRRGEIKPDFILCTTNSVFCNELLDFKRMQTLLQMFDVTVKAVNGRP